MNETIPTIDFQATDVLGQLEEIMALPQELFDHYQEQIIDTLKQELMTAEGLEEFKQNLEEKGSNLEQFMYTVKDSIDSIQMAYMDKYPQDRINFIKQILLIEYNAAASTLGDYTNVPIEFCRDNVTIPSYAHNTDSGLDVFALDDYVIAPSETALIPTGFKVAVPNGYELQVRPKSGRSLKSKLRIANTPGTIDAGYRDEVGIIVENINDRIVGIKVDKTEEGIVTNVSPIYGEDVIIAKGKAFAQLVLTQVKKVDWAPTEDITIIGEDRGGGFGSTDK